MKKTLKGYLLGFFSAAVLMSGVTYAENTTTLYDVVANGIKIIIDGKQFEPTDANGDSVEPFIYNGTTYLPVRAIGNAFNKDVNWDAENYTVIIGSKEFDYISKLPYVDNDQENCSTAEFTLKDSGIRLYQSGSGWQDKGEFPKQYVAYKLDGKYKKFIAEVYNDVANGSGAKVYFKGNGKKVLYSMPGISKQTPKTEIEIDVTGQDILYIEAANLDSYEAGIILDNARLLK